MRRLLLLGIALIVYGSLYPWEFQSAPGRLVVHSTWRQLLSGYTLRDAAVNLVLYLPVGAAGYLSLPRAAGVLPRIVLVSGAACLLSSSIEFAQMFMKGRVAAPIDVLANTAGAMAGACLAILRRSVLRPQHRIKPPRDLSALLLLPCWIGALAFPFVPVIRPSTLTQKAAAFFNSNPFHLGTILLSAFAWYLAGYVLAALQVWRPPVWLTLATLLVPAQVFISARYPHLAAFTGAVSGTILFTLTGRRLHAAAIASLVALLVLGLYPFDFTPGSVPFTWLPFGGFLQLRWENGIANFAAKIFQYGACIWLLIRSGTSVRAATVIVAGVLAVVEFAQVNLPGRTPEITDPLLALSLGFVFAETERAVARARQPV